MTVMQALKIPAGQLGVVGGNFWRLVEGDDIVLDRVALPVTVESEADALIALTAIREEQNDPVSDALILHRAERDRLLRESDWTQLPDSPVDQARWAIYRQALRDLDMADPDWPTKPEGDVSDEEKLRVERVLDRAARTILFDGKNKA